MEISFPPAIHWQRFNYGHERLSLWVDRISAVPTAHKPIPSTPPEVRGGDHFERLPVLHFALVGIFRAAKGLV